MPIIGKGMGKLAFSDILVGVAHGQPSGRSVALSIRNHKMHIHFGPVTLLPGKLPKKTTRQANKRCPLHHYS